MSFMINKTVHHPDKFLAKNCTLIQYQLPLLKHCFVLCSNNEHTNDELDIELMQFFLVEAKKLAHKYANNPESYIIAFSGQQIRKRANFHIHLFIINKRWQKAFVYSVLGCKNWCQAVVELIKIPS